MGDHNLEIDRVHTHIRTLVAFGFVTTTLMSTRRTRGARRGGRAQSGMSRRSLHNEIRGVLFTPSFDPPSYVDMPWNSAIVNIAGTGDFTVTPKLFLPVAVKQFGLVSTQTLQFRFLSCRIWALSVSRPLRCAFYGITAGSVQPIAVDTDWGAPQRVPKIGYRWPATLQNIVWDGGSGDTMFTVDVGTAENISWIAYVETLWRSDKYVPIADSVRYQQTFLHETNSSASSCVLLPP